MNVLIIEDEAWAARRLRILVEETFAKARVQAVFYEVLDSVSTAITFLQTAPPLDVLFLDIHLADGLSFEIFEHCSVNVPVIFTTAYDEYALKAFQLYSVDYLLKPIQASDVERAVDKFLAMHTLFASSSSQSTHVQSEQLPDIQALLASLSAIREEYQRTSTIPAYKSRFLVSTAQGFVSIPVQNIAYFYSEHKVSWLVTTDGKKYAVDFTLDHLTSVLEPRQFFRVNRQYIVHLNAIHSVVHHFTGKCIVKLQPTPSNDVILPREKLLLLKQWLDR